MNVLEALWYGNIYPTEQAVCGDHEYTQARQQAMDIKESLLPGLSAELQAKMEQLLDAQMQTAVIAERDAFLMGFRLGVQILVSGLTPSDI